MRFIKCVSRCFLLFQFFFHIQSPATHQSILFVHSQNSQIKTKSRTGKCYDELIHKTVDLLNTVAINSMYTTPQKANNVIVLFFYFFFFCFGHEPKWNYQRTLLLNCDQVSANEHRPCCSVIFSLSHSSISHNN